MPASLRRRLALMSAILCLGVCAPLWLAATATAGAVDGGPYYVAVGASESVGVQPTAAAPRGARTDAGYADDLVVLERARWPGLQLVDLGCPGITVTEAVQGSARCPYAAGSEVDQAIDFVRAHRASTVLVTVDLGFNDLRPCLAGMTVDDLCVDRALATLRSTLPGVLGGLERAGGPDMLTVGLEHADPFLADARLGGPPAAFADATVPVFNAFNDLLGRLYAANGVLAAPVPARLAPTATATAPVSQADLSSLCSLTWMCAPPPLGPNLHPNAAGYRLIAASIASALRAGNSSGRTADAAG